MGISPELPSQRSGAFGDVEARLFKMTWAGLSLVVTPLLQLAFYGVMAVLPREKHLR